MTRRISIAVPAFTDPGSCAPTWPRSSCRCWRSALAIWRLSPFVEPPESRHISDGLTLLKELEAVRELPATGDREAKLQLTGSVASSRVSPLDPRLAKMVISAAQTVCLSEVMVITAALSIQDPRERPMEKSRPPTSSTDVFEDKDSTSSLLLTSGTTLKSSRMLGSNRFAACARRSFSPICGYASGRTFTSSCVRRSRSWV